jgi:transcriptional regulator with XRE-family HTH domain
MYTIPLHLTALASDRDRALALVRAATGLPPLAAHSVVLTTDATATAVLRAAGIPPEDARPILATLWPQAPRPADPRPPNRPVVGVQDEAVRRELQFVRDLGERIHVIRHARRLTAAGVRNRTGIAPYLLRDLEAGDLWPSMLHLYRLAQAFAVPLPMLVDDQATPVADPAAAVRSDRLSRRLVAQRLVFAPVTLRYRVWRVERAFEGESAVVPEPPSSEPTIIVREPDLPRIAAAPEPSSVSWPGHGRPGNGTLNIWPRRWPAGRSTLTMTTAANTGWSSRPTSCAGPNSKPWPRSCGRCWISTGT